MISIIKSHNAVICVMGCEDLVALMSIVGVAISEIGTSRETLGASHLKSEDFMHRCQMITIYPDFVEEFDAALANLQSSIGGHTELYDESSLRGS